jgi:transposase-like protein
VLLSEQVYLRPYPSDRYPFQLEVDHATLNRWVLAYAPLIERRLRAFRRPHLNHNRGRALPP